MLEEKIVKLEQRDKDAQVMSQNMNEKLMDRTAKAEEKELKSNKLNLKYKRNMFILNTLKKKQKLAKYNSSGKYFYTNYIYDTAKINSMEKDILSRKLVEIVEVPVLCFKYDNEVYMYNNLNIK